MKRGLIVILFLLIVPVAMAQLSCKEICAEENYEGGICRVLTGANVCKDNEIQKELSLYCDVGKVCCCQKPDDGSLIEEMNVPSIITDSPGLELPEVALRPLDKQKEIISKTEEKKSIYSLFKLLIKKLILLLF